MPNVGPLEIIVVLALVLIIFGPKRLPELGRSLGKGIREFKGSISGIHDDDDDDDEQPPRALKPGELADAPQEKSKSESSTGS
ncbi:MAG: twin-arginine translocase TatA/TatE family subunit [Actinobacteria bacterium]|nr:twin-arginine translocase TatA/TatE family subunit [Actinomycetota bacterium]